MDDIRPEDVLSPEEISSDPVLMARARARYPGGAEAYDARIEQARERYEEEHGCGNCGGSGFVAAYSDLASVGWVTADCPDCHGRGVID